MQGDLPSRQPAHRSALTLRDGSRAGPEPVLTREDFAACVRAYRRRHRSPANWMLLAGMPGGLFMGLGLVVAAEQLGLGPNLAGPAFFSLGWLVALLSGGALVFQERRLQRQWGLGCLACGEAIVSSSHPHRADLVMATGRCPGCGASQFAEDDPEYAGRPATEYLDC